MCLSKLSLSVLIVAALHLSLLPHIMSETEKARLIHGGHRGVVTKIVKEVDDMLSSEGLQIATTGG